MRRLIQTLENQVNPLSLCSLERNAAPLTIFGILLTKRRSARSLAESCCILYLGPQVISTYELPDWRDAMFYGCTPNVETTFDNKPLRIAFQALSPSDHFPLVVDFRRQSNPADVIVYDPEERMPKILEAMART